MIHDNLEFHNIAELVNVDGFEGLRLQRATEKLRAQLNEGAAGVLLSPADCEIRFRIAEGKESAKITLSSESRTTVYVYYGPFQGPSFELGTEPQELEIKPHKRISQLIELDAYPEAKYYPGLVRICFGGPYPEPVFYHGHGGGVCPPLPGDTPEKTYMSYGTSITHGTGLAGAAISYPSHVAWRLGYDLKNFGSSGCCLCEKPLADFLAEQDCDLVTLEISVNMVGSHTGDEFKERAGYLVKKLADADPERPVVCMTIFPHFRDIDDSFCPPDQKSSPQEFRQILRDIVKDLDRPNIKLIEGTDLIPDISALTCDLIHPGARGMVQIGERLSQKLKNIL